MKYAAFPVVVGAVVLTFSPACAHMHMHGHMNMQAACSGDHLSKMTTMMSTMPDSPRKGMMNGHLAMVNSAMATGGTRGCEMAMMNMMHGSHMPMMKSGCRRMEAAE
jgi:hypothetical protein